MELQQLHHFVVTARLGSVGRAAEELNLTQSGLSRSIKSLEDFVGLPLFHRQSRGMALTPYGETLLRRATLIWHERDRAIAELRDLRLMRAGRVEIGLHSVFNYAFGNEVLSEFASRHPKVTLSVWSGADPEMTRRLTTGEVEFAFTLAPEASVESEVQFDALASLDCGVYCRPAHPLAKRHEVGFADLAAASWALCGGSGWLGDFEAFFAQGGEVMPERLMQTSSIALLVSAMLSRDLVTILPSFLVKADILADRLAPLPVPVAPAGVCAGLLQRADMVRTPSTDALSQIFRERAGQLSAG